MRNERTEALAYTKDRRKAEVNVRMLDWQEENYKTKTLVSTAYRIAEIERSDVW